MALDAAALLETAFLRASSRCLAWISAARRERWPRDSCPCGLGLTAPPPCGPAAPGPRLHMPRPARRRRGLGSSPRRSRPPRPPQWSAPSPRPWKGRPRRSRPWTRRCPRGPSRRSFRPGPRLRPRTSRPPRSCRRRRRAWPRPLPRIVRRRAPTILRRGRPAGPSPSTT